MRHTGPLPSRAGRRSVSGLFFLFARALVCACACLRVRAQETNRTDRIKSFFVEAVEPAETVENPEPAPPAAPTAGKTGKKTPFLLTPAGGFAALSLCKSGGKPPHKSAPVPSAAGNFPAPAGFAAALAAGGCLWKIRKPPHPVGKRCFSAFCRPGRRLSTGLPSHRFHNPSKPHIPALWEDFQPPPGTFPHTFPHLWKTSGQVRFGRGK